MSLTWDHGPLTRWKHWDDWATRSRLEPVKKVARMVKRHLGGILNYYTHRVEEVLLVDTWVVDALVAPSSPVHAMTTARGTEGSSGFSVAL